MSVRLVSVFRIKTTLLPSYMSFSPHATDAMDAEKLVFLSWGGYLGVVEFDSVPFFCLCLFFFYLYLFLYFSGVSFGVHFREGERGRGWGKGKGEVISKQSIATTRAFLVLS